MILLGPDSVAESWYHHPVPKQSLIPSYFKNPVWWMTGKVDHDPEFWSMFSNYDEAKAAVEDRAHNRNPWSRTKLAYTRWTTNRPHPIRAWQVFYARGRVGYDYSDTFSLHGYLLSWMPEAIADLRRGSYGYPSGICDCDEENYNHEGECNGSQRWDDVLCKIERGFRAGRAIDNLDYFEQGDPEGSREREKALQARFDEGMDLFKEWFFALWN